MWCCGKGTKLGARGPGTGPDPQLILCGPYIFKFFKALTLASSEIKRL